MRGEDDAEHDAMPPARTQSVFGHGKAIGIIGNQHRQAADLAQLTRIAEGIGWPRAQVSGTAAFYSFFHTRRRGVYRDAVEFGFHAHKARRNRARRRRGVRR